MINIFDKIKLFFPIFLPILFSTIFHFSFANLQKGNDYDSLVLFLSIIAVISTSLLLGKELQYYQSNNIKELIKQDLFTLVVSSLLISFLLFVFYKYGVTEFSFNPLLILFAPLKVVLDYFVIILNVQDKAKFARYTFDVLFGFVQVSTLLFYFFNLININQLILIFILYFISIITTYIIKLKINLFKVEYNYKFSYFRIGKAMISGLGSFVSRFQFMIMSVVSPNIIGLVNIAFTFSTTLSVPYNYLSKLNIPSVIKNKSVFYSQFKYVRNYSLLFLLPILLSIYLFVDFNPTKLKYFNDELFYYFLVLYMFASLIDIIVGLKSSIVQIFGNEKKLIFSLILILIISILIPLFFIPTFKGVIFYVTFIVLSNIFFYYKFKTCFEKDYL